MKFFLLNITTWLEIHQLPCPFKQLTHFDCPGCGIQRSFILLLKGDMPASFLMYPALLPILLLFALLIVHLIVKMRNGPVILKYAYFFCTGVILVSYIYKIITTKTI
jgi:hypothetical protein